MKKILVLTGMIVLAHTCAMAYMDESEASSLTTLKRQGYSDTTMEVIDNVKYRNSSENEKYVRRYVNKKGNFLGRGYEKLKLYVDPIQDDGQFGNHQIEFSNTWMGDKTFYSSELVRNKQVEDL